MRRGAFGPRAPVGAHRPWPDPAPRPGYGLGRAEGVRVGWWRGGGHARWAVGAAVALVGLAAAGTATGCSSAADAAPSPTTRVLDAGDPPDRAPGRSTPSRPTTSHPGWPCSATSPTATPGASTSTSRRPRRLPARRRGRSCAVRGAEQRQVALRATAHGTAGGAVVVVADYRVTEPQPPRSSTSAAPCASRCPARDVSAPSPAG